MAWWQIALYTVAFAVIMLIAFNLLNVFVFSKIRANKWIVLGAAILAFFLPALLGVNLQGNIFFSLLQSGVFVILFLWFMDISGFGKRRAAKSEKIVIRPKAKPNRVKKDK